MSQAMEKLEQKLRQLFEIIDHLEAENRSYRALVNGGGDHLTQAQIISELKSLRLEKEKIEKKMELVERGLTRVLEELDRLDI
ncbi:MAG TPA: hypothetical protein VM123_00200 [archaeon]|nr:hypothetical protein [archaeon]